MNQKAKKFEGKEEDVDDLAILIRWIGWDVEPRRAERPLKQVPIDGQFEPFTYGEKKYKFNRYGLTSRGEAINVDSYCLHLASSNRSTHVYLFQNWDKFNQISDEDIDWNTPFNELKVDDASGLQQFCSFHCYAPYLEKQLNKVIKKM